MENEKDHECDQCDKKFALSWRLMKHKKIHINKDIENCHYFNNNKSWPYEAIGCMFAHLLSEECKFGKKCAFKLCSFQHSEPTAIEVFVEENDNFTCQQCDKQNVNHLLLVEHVENIHVNQEKINTVYLFPQICANCPRWIYTEDTTHYD